ncbi:MAG: sigma-70 family RNA polymerase sigma factor [Candidatus Eisenbacteria sp.]|nr:sigma-70 family RNA polymerase sigma factor [Candidatus Eisenbacteria bacterium]
MEGGGQSGPDATDMELVARVLAGNLDAYAGLVDRYRDLVYSVVLRIAGNRADADDLSQEALVTAFRALATFRGDSKFSSWLYRIAVNLALAHVKRHQRAPLIHTDDEGRAAGALAAVTQDTPERALLDEEMRLHVRRAIAKLPPHYRAVITLYHLEERNYNEVAVILALPMGTVKTHLHRARALLRRIILQSLR